MKDNDVPMCEWCPDRVGASPRHLVLTRRNPGTGEMEPTGEVDPGWRYCAKKWAVEHPEADDAHPGTNCCADFGCCITTIASSPHAAVFAGLAAASAGSGPAVVAIPRLVATVGDD